MDTDLCGANPVLTQLEHLEKQVRSLQSEIVKRTDDMLHMDQQLTERQTAVQHCQSRIGHLEHSEAALKDNVSHTAIPV